MDAKERKRQYDLTYRTKHPDRVKESYRRYMESNRDKIYERNRQAYAEKGRNRPPSEKSMCPICQIMYVKQYLPKHMMNRHHMEKNDAMEKCGYKIKKMMISDEK